MLPIGQNTEITMHFSLALESGDVIDSTLDAKPGVFNFGDETLPSGFESLLVGLKAGDRRSFLVSPEKGFGEPRDENVQRFKVSKLQEMVEEPLTNGLTILFEDASGQYISGVIKNLPEGELDPNFLVSVDFNHPLAGRNLHFSVEIIDVKASAQTVNLL